MRSGGMANVVSQYWSEGAPTQMELFEDTDKDFETMISDFDPNQISEGNRDEIMALSKKAFQLRQDPAEQETS